MKKIFIILTSIVSFMFATYTCAANDYSMSANPAKAKEYFENKMAFTTGPVEVAHMMGKNNNMQIVDVRYADDFAKGHVPGAISLPPDSWDMAASKLSKDKMTIIYCYSQVCHLAAEAAIKLASQGYQVKEMEGGYKAWIDNKLQVDRRA